MQKQETVVTSVFSVGRGNGITFSLIAAEIKSRRVTTAGLFERESQPFVVGIVSLVSGDNVSANLVLWNSPSLHQRQCPRVLFFYF